MERSSRSRFRRSKASARQVKYQSEGTVKYQQVLIKDNSFRVGDTKFQMTANNKATIKNVVTDAATGSTYLDTAFATRNV